MHTNLIVDLNNLVFTTRFSKVKTPSNKKRKEEMVTELIFKDTLSAIVHYAHTFKADAIVITCDSSNVWRKDVYPEYKANRDHADVYYEETIAAAELTKKFFRECTNASVLEVPRAEADDIIAVICQESKDVDNIILSADKDFIQLINERTRLYSPAQGVWRESEDAGYELFLKCIRGDSNDNIKSAFPRIWEKKVRAAWDDCYAMMNLMETVRKDGLKVGDEFDRNRTLIDLTMQPDYIRTAILTAIYAPTQRKFGELRMMKFLSDHNLKSFCDMLQFKERPLQGFFKLDSGNK